MYISVVGVCVVAAREVHGLGGQVQHKRNTRGKSLILELYKNNLSPAEHTKAAMGSESRILVDQIIVPAQ